MCHIATPLYFIDAYSNYIPSHLRCSAYSSFARNLWDLLVLRNNAAFTVSWLASTAGNESSVNSFCLSLSWVISLVGSPIPPNSQSQRLRRPTRFNRGHFLWGGPWPKNLSANTCKIYNIKEQQPSQWSPDNIFQQLPNPNSTLLKWNNRFSITNKTINMYHCQQNCPLTSSVSKDFATG